MPLKVEYLESAAAFLAEADAFLASGPIEHNLVATVAAETALHDEPGYFWVLRNGNGIVGVALQSGPDRRLLITPMPPSATALLAETVVRSGISIPGVMGEVASAAAFAGSWTEYAKSCAVPLVGQRLYLLDQLNSSPAVSGEPRVAGPSDRAMLVNWVAAFYREAAGRVADPTREVDRWIAASSAWIWQDGEPSMMMVARPARHGIVRFSVAYTPPERRSRGYAGACIASMARKTLSMGCRCTLYADLANPISNSVYRRLGFRAVSEVMHYRFGPFDR